MMVVIVMKKYVFPVTLALLVGLFMSNFFINQYDDAGSIKINMGSEKIYYVQHGVYSSKDSMMTAMTNFENYIYNEEDGNYYAYVGISKNKENAEKIKKYFNDKGYEAYIKEKKVDNEGFLTILGQYDNILAETDSEETIKVICNQVLAKYEEIINADV